jgi:hypothetical protein
MAPRLPATLLHGRLRTSTLLLSLLFLAVLALYLQVRPPPTGTTSSAEGTTTPTRAPTTSAARTTTTAASAPTTTSSRTTESPATSGSPTPSP